MWMEKYRKVRRAGMVHACTCDPCAKLYVHPASPPASTGVSACRGGGAGSGCDDDFGGAMLMLAVSLRAVVHYERGWGAR